MNCLRFILRFFLFGTVSSGNAFLFVVRSWISDFKSNEKQNKRERKWHPSIMYWYKWEPDWNKNKSNYGIFRTTSMTTDQSNQKWRLVRRIELYCRVWRECCLISFEQSHGQWHICVWHSTLINIFRHQPPFFCYCQRKIRNLFLSIDFFFYFRFSSNWPGCSVFCSAFHLNIVRQLSMNYRRLPSRICVPEMNSDAQVRCRRLIHSYSSLFVVVECAP